MKFSPLHHSSHRHNRFHPSPRQERQIDRNHGRMGHLADDQLHQAFQEQMLIHDRKFLLGCGGTLKRKVRGHTNKLVEGDEAA